MSSTRLKKSFSGVHRLQENELQALTQLRQRYPDGFQVFINERGERLTTRAIVKIMERAGELAELPLPVHAATQLRILCIGGHPRCG